MMRSLWAGVSGMQNHQTRMDVIGNNIANVNTTGFKKGRVDFQDMISQQLSGAAAPTTEVGGVNAKPSKEVKPGEVIQVHKGTVFYTYKVIKPLHNRVGASLVEEYAENLTPEEELAKLHAPVETFFVRRERGAGRPTKKERRTIDALWDSFDSDEE